MRKTILDEAIRQATLERKAYLKSARKLDAAGSLNAIGDWHGVCACDNIIDRLKRLKARRARSGGKQG
jgi:hypothetical protein